MIALLLAVPALAAGGVGVSLSDAHLGYLGPDDVHAGAMPCLGFEAYSIAGERRLGGEGATCDNDAGGLSYLGLQGGKQHRAGVVYWGGWVGAGAGWLAATDPSVGRYRSAFLYVRPALGAGIPFGFGAVEADVHLMLPAPVFQEVSDGIRPMGLFPYVGTDVTFLIGNFHKDRVARNDDVPPPPVDAPPNSGAADGGATDGVPEDGVPRDGGAGDGSAAGGGAAGGGATTNPEDVPRPPLPGTQKTTRQPPPPPPDDASGVEGEGGEDDRPLAIPAGR